MALRLTTRGRLSVGVLALTLTTAVASLARSQPSLHGGPMEDPAASAASAASAAASAAGPRDDLRAGDRGEGVLALERRLAELRLDIGPVDGVFDDDTAHAVTALQKIDGLPPTGRVDEATQDRLSAPLEVALRHPAAGRALEVDLTRQVMYLTRAGQVERVFDVSTGSNAMIEVSGKPERAVTPLGTYRIQRRIDGIRYAPLGELYRPAYFVEGWAVHGSPDVRPFPVSHGCVRVTDAAQDRLWPLLTIGTPISLYGAYRA
jgi:hypothetical protein